MRDDSQVYEAFDTVEAAGVSRLSAAAAAVVSLTALALVVAWTYRLGVRDAADVPVIRAVEGPARIRPEDPGGERVAHQGRAVYGLMDGAPAGAEPVALAPPPERPAAEDIAVARAAIAPAADVEPAAAPEPQRDVATSALDALGSEIDRLVASVAGGAEPPAGAAATPAPRPRPAGATTASPAGATAPTLAGATAPTLAGATAPTLAGAAEPSAAPAAASLPAGGAGGPTVQLGAYLTAEDARARWAGLAARSGGLLSGRGPIVAAIPGSQRTLYGLRAGPFASADDAASMCAALKARGLDCIQPRS